VTVLKNKVSTAVFTVKPGVVFPEQLLKDALPDTESALFFAKLYKLSSYQLSSLLGILFGDNDVIAALTAEGGMHSEELQDFIVELGYEYLIELGDVEIVAGPPHAEILPELWESLEVEIAKSITDVAEKLTDVVSHMPGKEGAMVFRSMMTLNAKRPTIGDYKAHIHHKPQAPNLVILDVSGSMSRSTVRTIIDDVVALSWKANAHLAIVSNTTTFWDPGSFSSEAVLKAAEFGGTQYETLSELLNQDWGVVVTIADYDSSRSSKSALAQCTGEIELVLDISLVNQPTFLAECVGQRAQEVRPLLIAQGNLTN
jgi:hypothetical protein